MYSELIDLLANKHVVFTSGLTASEFSQIEDIYGIHFPAELREFYTEALPVSKGFYDWTDYRTDNIELIKRRLNIPIEGILDDVQDVEWRDSWGKEPESIEEKREIITRLYSKAPKLLPIYGHRYIADKDVEKNPVFSIYGTDIIYYGKNLKDYFEIEFGLKKHSPFRIDEVTYIPFWTDLL